MAKPRRRRSAEDAREHILAIAEQQLIASGPASLRLQDLAAEVGVSHPAILHHFGSRDGLIKAVVERAVASLQTDLMKAIAGAGTEYQGLPLLERVYDTLATRGHARLMAWLLLAGYDPLDGTQIRAQWKQIIDATHAARVTATQHAPARDDTAFAVMLSAIALFGEALAGPSVFSAGGLGRTARVQAQWRAWLAELIGSHLARG